MIPQNLNILMNCMPAVSPEILIFFVCGLNYHIYCRLRNRFSGQPLSPRALKSWDVLLNFLPLLCVDVWLYILMCLQFYISGDYYNTPSGLPSPPKPNQVPIFGFLLYLKKDYHIQLTELARKHGPVYEIDLGQEKAVVVSNYNLIKEAFAKSVFSSRPDTQLTRLLEGYGVINSNGPLWKEQRSFLHRTLREFGMNAYGRRGNFLEKTIKVQTSRFLTSVRKADSAPIEIRQFLKRGVSNVIGSILMDVTLDDDQTGFARLMYLIEDGFRLASLSMSFNFLPCLRRIPYLNRNFKLLNEHLNECRRYISTIVEDHKSTLDQENVRDFIDLFLIQQQRLNEGNNGKENYFSDEQLVQMIADVFSAGYETVTSFLEWSILFLVRNPEVQDRIREEMDEVVGWDRNPEVGDMRNMPYTEATMYEILRLANIIAIGNAHAAVEDTELGGFRIQKGTHILPNFWAVHMSSEHWSEPERFMPERFLSDSEDGRRIVIKPHYFMPFSTGLRMCVGEVFARIEVFLFLTHILRYFDLQAPEDDLSAVQTVTHVSLKPESFKIRAVLRQENEYIPIDDILNNIKDDLPE